MKGTEMDQPRYTVEPHGETFRVIDHNDERPVENSFGVMDMPRELADMTAEVLNKRFGGPDRW